MKSKKKDKRIVDLQLEINRLQRKIWNNEEYFLQSENEMLKKKLKRSVKWLTGLTGRYFEQENVIKKLQKEKIETIGKLMISFIYNQQKWLEEFSYLIIWVYMMITYQWK